MKYFVYNPKITITKQNVEEEKDRQNIDINKMMRLELLETNILFYIFNFIICDDKSIFWQILDKIWLICFYVLIL